MYLFSMGIASKYSDILFPTLCFKYNREGERIKDVFLSEKPHRKIQLHASL